jgi:hypothetical protein
MDATEAALDSALNGSEPNTASVLKGWRTFHHHLNHIFRILYVKAIQLVKPAGLPSNTP